MIRPAVLLLASLLPSTTVAEGLNLTAQERVAFESEMRDALLANGQILSDIVTRPPDLYSENVEADRQRLADNAALFAATDRGYGAETPRLTVLFFEDYPCADCKDAWQDLVALADAYPDIRIEPRFAANSGPAQLLLSILDRQGADAYREVRDTLLQAKTEEALEAALAKGAWIQDKMMRPAPQIEAEAFRTLEFDTVPAYVFPDMMLQGAMPSIVLRKYLAD